MGPDVLQLLLDYDAELDREVLYPDFRIYRTDLSKRKVETIQFLVRAGLDINEVDEERGTPLHHSVKKGMLRMLDCCYKLVRIRPWCFVILLSVKSRH